MKRKYFSEKYNLPSHIVADIIMQFSSNLKGNITKLCKNQMNDFNFSFKEFNSNKLVLAIQKFETSEKGFYSAKFGDILTDEKDFDWKAIQGDYKIVYDRYSKTYHIHIPSYKKHSDITNQRKPFIVGDPGARKFQQFYGIDHMITVGERLHGPIMEKICRTESINRLLKDKETKLSRRSRRNMKHVIFRIYNQIHNMIDEMHFKLCIFLCRNYDRIMTTDFSSKKVNGVDGPLRANTKKVLGQLSHYKFRQRLKQKCSEYRCQYIEVTEELTSKTCCRCGTITKVGKGEIYKCSNEKCPSNKEPIDRDSNAMVCIFLKNQNVVLEK